MADPHSAIGAQDATAIEGVDIDDDDDLDLVLALDGKKPTLRLNPGLATSRASLPPAPRRPRKA